MKPKRKLRGAVVGDETVCKNGMWFYEFGYPHICNRPAGHKGPHQETTIVTWPNKSKKEK